MASFLHEVDYLLAGGSILGGIGVCGAPSGKTDEVCAAAGVNAISDDLKMTATE